MRLYIESEAVGVPYGAGERTLAGRRAAQKALRRCGAPSTKLGRTRFGAPRFPEGFSGSISHTDRIAVAVVSPEERLIGIDVEVASFGPEIDRLLIRSDVERTIADNPDFGRIGVWVAKEAAFKALHAQRRLHNGIFLQIRLNLQANELTVEGDLTGVRIFVRRVDNYAAALAVSEVMDS